MVAKGEGVYKLSHLELLSVLYFLLNKHCIQTLNFMSHFRAFSEINSL